MQVEQATLIVVGVMLTFFMLVVYARSGHFWRSLLGGALPGVAALGVVNYLAGYTGVSLAVNGLSLFVSAVLGLPGVISLFLLRMMWGL